MRRQTVPLRPHNSEATHHSVKGRIGLVETDGLPINHSVQARYKVSYAVALFYGSMFSLHLQQFG